MSKCDISIRFDREDRTYAGGEPITGRAVITVNNDVSCNGITLAHHWRTHGRGNASFGPKETVELAPSGPLVAGEKLELPFSLTAPTHPVTYHGNLINIDHYVVVEVNIPWASNPKVEEEYLLRAGEPPAQFVGSRIALISLAPQPQKTGPVGIVIACVLLLIFMIPLAMFAICLVPIALIVVGIVWMIRRALVSRLGDVQLTIPRVIVAPGEDWNLRIRFQPRKQFHINGIFLTLSGKESAKSGSGTQSTTHSHDVHVQKLVIRPAGILEAGIPIDESFSLPFPATTAYSFEETDNKVHWNAEIRIDIPKFPDWTTNQPLQVVPIEFLKKLTDGGATQSQVAVLQLKTLDETIPISQPESVSNPPQLPGSMMEPYGGLQMVSPPTDLGELATRIAAVSRHGHGRADVIASVLGTVFDANIIVDRVNSSMGVTTIQPGYEDGKTVVGTIQGTDQSIQVMTPKSLNDDVGNLRRGSEWQVPITILGWDSLFDRINACQ